MNTKQNGFTLLELTIVLLIIGIMVGGLFTLIPAQQSIEQTKSVEAQLDRIQKAIDTYVSIYGRLPCPASTNSELNSPHFGIETDCSTPTATATYEINGLSSNENIRFGVLPTRALSIPDSDSVDPWGYRINYAVVKNLARTSTIFNSFTTTQTDTFLINDINGNRINKVSTTNEPNFVAYVLWAPGPNKNGAASRDGLTYWACNPLTLEGENCDNDHIFIDSIYSTGTLGDYAQVFRWKTYQALVRDAGISSKVLTSLGLSGFRKVGVFTHTTNGIAGSGVGGTWNTRTINTIKFNTLTSATLAGNVITLGPGEYYIRATGTAQGVNRNILRIYDVTNNTPISIGLQGEADVININTGSSNFLHYFKSNTSVTAYLSLSTSTQIRIDHYLESSNAHAYGLVAAPPGTSVDYLLVEIFEK